jgi:hypothetical protein
MQHTYILNPKLPLSLLPLPFNYLFKRDTQGINEGGLLLSIEPIGDLAWFDAEGSFLICPEDLIGILDIARGGDFGITDGFYFFHSIAVI